MYFAAVNLGDAWGWIVIAGLVVVAFIYLFSTGKRGRDDIIRQDNADLRASNQELRNQRAVDEATLKEQREMIHQLRDIATQTPAVTKLIEMNNRQSKQTAEQHQQVITELSKLTGQISNLAAEFGRMAKAINQSYNNGQTPSTKPHGGSK
jgi:chromosome segregation ATPase